jgi:hypothetical protein
MTQLLLALLLSSSEGPWIAKPPASLSAPMGQCTPKEFFGRRLSDPLMTINELEAEDGTLYALFFIAGFSPDGTHLFQRGAFYFHLDDSPAIYEQYPPNRFEQKGYFFSLRFSGLARGSHRIAYAIVARDRRFVAYGQRCFTIHGAQREFFDTSRIMPIFRPK